MNSGEGRRTKIDIILVFCVVVLTVFGLIMIYSTSAYEANAQFQNPTYYFRKQMIAVALGLLVFGATMFIDYRLYKKIPPVLYIILSVLFILLLKSSLAYSANGATRWLRIFGFSFQPAELVKTCMIMYVASRIRIDSETTWRELLKIMAVPGIMALLIVLISNNMSSAIIVVAIPLVMCFVISKDYRRFIIIAIAAVAIAAILVLIVANQDKFGGQGGFRFARIKAWLDVDKYSSGISYQTVQSLYAIGSGGFWGKGIGESVQKLGFIPEAQNDMIFAVMCEELGLFGAFIVMTVFALLIYRCVYAAAGARDKTGCMIATGVMTHIAVQVILNIAVVTNTIPNTGISLPFISYGGSSIIFLMAEVGIVANIGRSSGE